MPQNVSHAFLIMNGQLTTMEGTVILFGRQSVLVTHASVKNKLSIMKLTIRAGRCLVLYLVPGVYKQKIYALVVIHPRLLSRQEPMETTTSEFVHVLTLR
jgi:hypothetical protein